MTKRTVTRKRRGTKAKPATGGKRGTTIGEILAERGMLPKGGNQGGGNTPKVSGSPVDREIKRAAERMNVLPQMTEADAAGFGLTDEDKALLADTVVPSKVAEHVMRAGRINGCDSEALASSLRSEAHVLRDIAARLTPRPETRDAMLADALKVVRAAEQTFYVDGQTYFDSDPTEILFEALQSLEQDLDMFANHAESCDQDIPWQAFWRARDRAELARKLAEFRQRHGVYEPLKTSEEQAGGAS